MRELQKGHPALRGTTIFLKQVKDPCKVTRLLQPASSNKKLGGGKGIVAKGKWRGFPMYSLSLEERATCPSTCQQWRNCYGNNMPFANRIDVKNPSFKSTLTQEVSDLAKKHTNGLLIRLHVLGDFYSVEYVRLWKTLIRKHPNLHVFGYTHRLPTSSIGKEIQSMQNDRCWIRWSDQGGPMSANCDQHGIIAEGITCPEQTGKTESCLTCGLCWATKMPIRFLSH